MGRKGLYAHITEKYSDAILNWAIKKAGSREEGEDLAQEVFYQVFLCASRQARSISWTISFGRSPIMSGATICACAG